MSINSFPGIGQTVAVSFASEGCRRIVVADLSIEGLEKTASLIASTSTETQVVQVVIDVSQPGDVSGLLQKAVETFGRVDYAVNAAGILSMDHRSHETSVESFDRVLAVDYKGSWLCSREEIKHMLGQEPLETHDGRTGNRGCVHRSNTYLHTVLMSLKIDSEHCKSAWDCGKTYRS